LTYDRYTLRGGALQQLKAAPAHFAGISIPPDLEIAAAATPLTTARLFFSLPLVTFKIVSAIHWEALRLWLKRARLVQRADAAPANTAFNTGLAIRKHADYTGPTLSAAGREPGSRESALVR
jgi:Protein of unknown function (DUF1365)